MRITKCALNALKHSIPVNPRRGEKFNVGAMKQLKYIDRSKQFYRISKNPTTPQSKNDFKDS